MGTLRLSAEKVLALHRGTMSPICAQCRKSMVLVICEPDFHDSMVATYRCQDVGYWIARKSFYCARRWARSRPVAPGV